MKVSGEETLEPMRLAILVKVSTDVVIRVKMIGLCFGLALWLFIAYELRRGSAGV